MCDQDNESVEAEDRYDTDEPPDGEDGQKSNLLAHGNLQGPDDANGKEGDEEIGYDVDASVHIPNPVIQLALRIVRRSTLVTLTSCCQYTSKLAAPGSSSRRGQGRM